MHEPVVVCIKLQYELWNPHIFLHQFQSCPCITASEIFYTMFLIYSIASHLQNI